MVKVHSIRDPKTGDLIAAAFGPGFDQYAESLSVFSKSSERGRRHDPATTRNRAMNRPSGGPLHAPNKSLESFAEAGIMTLEKILIHETYRGKARAELARYGINESSLFPDLDGLSAYLKLDR